MAALPLDVATGIVAGRLTRAAAPGTIGEPIPNARVTLTPDFEIATATHASPPVLILPDPVRCITDETGLLLDERGNPGVELVATDAPGLEPVAWTWRVVVHSPATGAQRWSILVPAGQTTDLSTAVHVPSDTGQAILEWQAVRDDALAARDAAQGHADDAHEAAQAAQLAASMTVQATLGGRPGTLVLTFPALAAGPYPNTVRVPIGA